MYNENVKNEYLATISSESSKQLFINFFNDIQYIEEQHNKDIFNFTIDEIFTFYKSKCCTSFDALNCLNVSLKRYSKFAYAKGYTDVDNFKNINQDLVLGCIIKAIQQKQIVTRDKLVNEIMPKVMHNYVKFCILAFFEGLDGNAYEEIRYAKLSDIHEDTISLCTGRSLKISKELIELAELSSKTESYISNDKEIMFNNDSPYIVKPKQNSRAVDGAVSRNAIYLAIQNEAKNQNIECLSVKKLKESGMIDIVKNTMLARNIKALPAIRVCKEEIESRYMITLDVNLFYKTFKDYL